MANPNNPSDNPDANTAGAASGTGFQEKIDAAKTQIRNVAEDLKAAAESKTRDLRANAEAKAREYGAAAGVKAEELAGELRGKAEDYYGQARERARTLQDDGEAYVRDNPMRALGVAAAAGFVLGVLFRR